MTELNDERLGAAEQPKRGRGRPPHVNSFNVDARDDADTDDGRDYALDQRKTDNDFLSIFRDTNQQSVLPDLPRMPGYHLCWLTTTNPRDSIQRRVMIGYELIKSDMLPGFEGVSIKTGDYSGVIGVNEMVAARLPLSLYNKYMREVHHDLPLDEEEKLRAMIDNIKEIAGQRGTRVEEGDGTADIVQRAAPMQQFQD